MTKPWTREDLHPDDGPPKRSAAYLTRVRTACRDGAPRWPSKAAAQRIARERELQTGRRIAAHGCPSCLGWHVLGRAP